MDKQNNLNKNLLEFYESVKICRRLDNSFAVDGDIPLTEEEKRGDRQILGQIQICLSGN